MEASGHGALSTAELEALCTRACAGDEEALEHLVVAHRGRLLSHLKRKIGVDWQGRIDPEDVLQETLVAVFRDIAGFTYRDGDSFYRWAARILDNRFIDHVRRLRAAKRDVQRETRPDAAMGSRYGSLFDRHFCESSTASKVLKREDAVAALMACIARLPEDYRVVVQRCHLGEEPFARVAADMGRSEDAIRRLAGRALERLHECLGRASHYLTRV